MIVKDQYVYVQHSGLYGELAVLSQSLPMVLANLTQQKVTYALSTMPRFTRF